MKYASQLLVWVGFGLMATFVLLWSLFSAGYVFEDPGGWAAVGFVIAFALPMVLLAVGAWFWPTLGTWVLGIATAIALGGYLWVAIDPETIRTAMDQTGPFLGVGMTVLLLPLAVLGLKRPLTAGGLMSALAVLSYASFVAGLMRDDWQGFGGTLMTSSTVACLPTLIVGLVFLAAGTLRHLDGKRSATPPQTQPPIGGRHLPTAA